jgi:CheY-like chemotaxis protein
MHGGTVSGASDGEGQGSTFIVTIPVLPEPSTSQKTAAPASNRDPGQRVLVVDDNRDGAKSLAMMLRLLGNQVEMAHDGIEAIEQAERFRPDVILMDIGMPRLNGLDAARRILAEPWGATIPIFALTGWGQDSDREKSRDAGCAGHMVKPVTLPDLERMLRESRANGR